VRSIALGRRHSFRCQAQEFIAGNQNAFSVPRGFHHAAPDIADQRMLADPEEFRALLNRVLKAGRELHCNSAHAYRVKNDIAHGND